MKGGIGFKKVKCYEVDFLIDLRMIKPEQTLNDFDRERFFATQIKGVLLIVNTAKENFLTDAKAKKDAIVLYCNQKNIPQLPIYIIEIEDDSEKRVISKQEVKNFCEENRLKCFECDENNKRDICTVIYCM